MKVDPKSTIPQQISLWSDHHVILKGQKPYITIFSTFVSTSPNWCFCTTWCNRKPRNCLFYL